MMNLTYVRQHAVSIETDGMMLWITYLIMAKVTGLTEGEVQMTDLEKFLIKLLKELPNNERRAIMLQSFIQANGPLSNQAAEIVREIIKHG